jgi:hypothetical protein
MPFRPGRIANPSYTERDGLGSVVVTHINDLQSGLPRREYT